MLAVYYVFLPINMKYVILLLCLTYFLDLFSAVDCFFPLFSFNDFSSKKWKNSFTSEENDKIFSLVKVFCHFPH